MTNPYFVAAMVAALLLGAPSHGQSAADLLQKGIHAQETVGDVDGAIQIFRQVAASPATNKVLAAQAQYQLVVCMLQKGDRGAALWTTNTMDSVYAFAIASGWRTPTEGNILYRVEMGPGPEGSASLINPDGNEQVVLNVRNVHTPKAEIAQALQKAMAGSGKEYRRSACGRRA
jgi:hypothetical protein